MDPRRWPAEHKVALAIAIALGVVVALVVGFHLSDGEYHFWDWARPRTPYKMAYSTMWQGYWAIGGGPPWATLGALVGGALVYLVKLLR